MYIDETTQCEEKKLIQDSDRMLPDESYTFHPVYYPALIHKTLIDTDRTPFYEIRQEYWIYWSLYILLQIQLEIVLVPVVQF